MLNGLAVLAGGLVSEFVPEWVIKMIAALAFLYFAASTIAGDDKEEEEGGKTKIKFAPLAVFCTFFVAELGDKTQLTAITFGANEGMRAALVVWIGCSLGLFAADMLGMLIGYLLKSKTPDGLLSMLAFAIFSIFGVYTLYQGLKLVWRKRLSNSGNSGACSRDDCLCRLVRVPLCKTGEKEENSIR